MRLVVDANVLFSVLIKDGASAELFVNPVFDLCVPAFFFEEFEKHKEEIFSKSHRSGEDFFEVLKELKEIINVYNKESYDKFIEEAMTVCPDENDSEYFALALKLECGIWSNDKGLKEQEKVEIYSTEELANRFLQ